VVSDPRAAADRLEHELAAVGTPERAAGSQAYLKSDLRFVGATVPQSRTLVKALLKAHPDWSTADVRELAAALWDEPAADPIFERRLAAVLLLTQDRSRAQPADLALVERLLRESATWALVDALSTDVAGDLVERYPVLGVELDRWATDANFWIRRAALLTLLLPLRRGEGDWDHFTRLADPMLEEREFFIRKAIGWVLRETAKRRPELVADWVRPRLARISRLSLREAVKPMTEELRSALLR
jgi:3-methyladenine DNA glycosylase AlkD